MVIADPALLPERPPCWGCPSSWNPMMPLPREVGQGLEPRRSVPFPSRRPVVPGELDEGAMAPMCWPPCSVPVTAT